MINKFTLILIALVLQYGISGAQFSSELMPKAPVMSSPEASSITRFVDMPVDFRTGVADITIPIFNLVNGDIQVPVNLKHAGTGIKIRELAGPVGLGWSLHAGGVITSVVNGRPGGVPFETPEEVQDYFQTYSDTVIHQNEREPDYLTYSFLGHSGKFLFNAAGKGLITPASDLSINYLPGDSTITITDPRGFTYHFNEQEKQKTESTCPGGDMWGEMDFVDMAYYLTEVESPMGRKVEFKYKTYSYAYYSNVDQSESLWAGGNAPPIPASTCWTKNTILEGKVLEEIISDNGYRVEFNYSASRNDLPDGNNLGKLEEIVIYFQNKVIKSYDLVHSYFSCTAPIRSAVPSDFYSDDHAGYSRLMLNSIREAGSEPYTFAYNLDYNPSRFSYGTDHWGYYNGKDQNESMISYDVNFMIGSDREASAEHMQAFALTGITFPTKGTQTLEYEPNYVTIDSANMRDRFYKFKEEKAECTGNDEITEVISIPAFATVNTVKLFYWTNSPRTEDLAPEEGQPFSRTVLSWTHNSEFHSTVLTGYGNTHSYYDDVTLLPGVAYTLTIETLGLVSGNPVKTAVRVVWMEEIFDSQGSGQADLLCGGVRIKSITNDAQSGEGTIARTYKYPAHQDSVNYRTQLSWYYTYTRTTGWANPSEVYRRSSNSLIPLIPVTYNRVEELFSNEGMNSGKTVYYYSYQENQLHLAPGSSLYAETDNSWLGGDLIRKIHYKNITDSTFQKVEETEYSYKTHGDGSSFYVSAVEPHEFHAYGAKSTIKIPHYIAPLAFIPAVYHQEVYKVWGAFKYLEKEITRKYSGSASLVQEKEYIYNIDNMTLSKEIQRGNDWIMTEYKRVGDVTATAGSVLDSMQARGITQPVIEARKFLIGGAVQQLLEGVYLQYGEHPTTTPGKFSYQPVAAHILETNVPINVTFDYADETSFTTEPGIESSYASQYSITSSYAYDSGMNITDVLQRDGIYQSIKYDSFSRPVAIARNAQSSYVFAENFESQSFSPCFQDFEARSGKGALCAASYVIPASFDPPGTSGLVMSYWYMISGNWKFSGTLPYAGTINAPTGTQAIDDVRIRPAAAELTTYTYDDGWGINSQADVNSLFRFYDYDNYGTLIRIKDNNKDIGQSFIRHFKTGITPH